MKLESVTCAICDSQHTRPVYEKFGLTIARCIKCGLIFSNPRLPREEVWRRYSQEYFWHEYLPSYGVRDGKYDLESFDSRYAVMLDLIAENVQSPGWLLEVGAGAGFFLKAAERAGWKVAGIEISDEGVRFARDELGLNVEKESAEELSFPPESFDAVVMLEVIEHLLNPLHVLTLVRRVLRPKGLLVITTPNFNALSRFALGRKWAVLTPAEHLFIFTETTLRKLLERAGFNSVRFVHQYAGFGVFEIMNPRCTHAPHSLRAKAYLMLVMALGLFLYRRIQACGKGDTLLCFAYAR